MSFRLFFAIWMVVAGCVVLLFSPDEAPVSIVAGVCTIIGLRDIMISMDRETED